MYLNRDDQDYGHIPIVGVPDGETPIVTVGLHLPQDLEADPDFPDDIDPISNQPRSWWRVLLRGPDYQDDEQGLLVDADVTAVKVRLKDSPVSVSDDAGTIHLRTL